MHYVLSLAKLPELIHPLHILTLILNKPGFVSTSILKHIAGTLASSVGSAAVSSSALDHLDMSCTWPSPSRRSYS